MGEKQRILKMLSDLYDGSPWTDLSILGVVGDLTAAQASAKPIAQMHSVWEYFNHIIYWRTVIARILSGQAGRQDGDAADFEQIPDTSETAWRETLSRLERCQETLVGVVSKVCDGKLDAFDQNFKATYYELIQGVVQHDAYHLGQAMIVKKIVASAGRIIV